MWAAQSGCRYLLLAARAIYGVAGYCAIVIPASPDQVRGCRNDESTPANVKLWESPGTAGFTQEKLFWFNETSEPFAKLLFIPRYLRANGLLHA
jgi:hypothetical protein